MKAAKCTLTLAHSSSLAHYVSYELVEWVEYDMQVNMNGVKANTDGVEAKMNWMDAKMEAKMNGMDVKMEELKINLNKILQEMVTNGEG